MIFGIRVAVRIASRMRLLESDATAANTRKRKGAKVTEERLAEIKRHAEWPIKNIVGPSIVQLDPFVVLNLIAEIERLRVIEAAARRLFAAIVDESTSITEGVEARIAMRDALGGDMQSELDRIAGGEG